MPTTIIRSATSPFPRKRTSSTIPCDDEPPSKKTATMNMHMTPLRRTETLLLIPPQHHQTGALSATVFHGVDTQTSKIQYSRNHRHYKDVRDRRPRCNNKRPDFIVLHTPETASNQKSLLPFSPSCSPIIQEKPRLTRSRTVPMHLSSLSIPTSPPQTPLPPTPQPTPVPQQQFMRTTSPLAPHSLPAHPRPTFPRSKPQQNLHRAAIQGCMRDSPHGQKILHMGARLAVSLAKATEELERLVAMNSDSQQLRSGFDDDDVNMDEPDTMSNSWVDVRPSEDWIMLDQTQCVI